MNPTHYYKYYETMHVVPVYSEWNRTLEKTTLTSFNHQFWQWAGDCSRVASVCLFSIDYGWHSACDKCNPKVGRHLVLTYFNRGEPMSSCICLKWKIFLIHCHSDAKCSFFSKSWAVALSFPSSKEHWHLLVESRLAALLYLSQRVCGCVSRFWL